MYTSLEQFKEEKLKEFDITFGWLNQMFSTNGKHKSTGAQLKSFLSQAIDEAAEATVEAVYGGGNTIATTLDDLKSTDGETTSIIRANIGSWLTPTKETL